MASNYNRKGSLKEVAGDNNNKGRNRYKARIGISGY
jgi:hypothetical protein